MVRISIIQICTQMYEWSFIVIYMCAPNYIVLDNKDNDLKLLINIADLIDDGRLDKYKMMH